MLETMGRKCSVKGCKTGYRGNPIKIPIFRFPKNDLELREQWAKTIGKNLNDVSENNGVCARHFPANVKMGRKKGHWCPLEPPSLYLSILSDSQSILNDDHRKESANYSQKLAMVNQLIENPFANYDDDDDSQFDFCTPMVHFEEDISHLQVYNSEKEMYTENKVPAISLPINTTNKGYESTANSDAVLQFLIKAIYEIFVQHVGFESELKIGGVIEFYFDQGKKREYVLDKTFKECSVEQNVSKINHIVSKVCSEEEHIELQDLRDENKTNKVKQEHETLIDKVGKEEQITLASVYNHMNELHPQRIVKPKTQHICSICNATFTEKYDLAKHVEFHSFQICCKLCGDRFKHSASYGKHVEQYHTGYKPYVCLLCDMAFDKMYKLHRHERKHHIEKHKCDQCFKEYKCIQSLRSHTMRNHKPDACKFYYCKICHQSFFRKSNYKLHLMRHKNLKPFQCQECGKCFCKNWELNVHKKCYHSEGRLFICEFCGSGYKHVSNLLSHCKSQHFNKDISMDIRLSTNNPLKTFTCLICNKKYSKFLVLKKHVEGHCRIQETICLTCPICCLQFTKKSTLKKHIRINHET